MQFRLRTLMLLFVILWSSLAAWGRMGVPVTIAIVVSAVLIHRKRAPLWESLVVICIIGVLIALLLPSTQAAYGSARRDACAHNLKQIALALHNYRQANGCFPPAYIADKNGRPMHSWRVLILPYLEPNSSYKQYNSLYKQYNFKEPWNGPNNNKLLAARPSEYSCPTSAFTNPQDTTQTNYVAVVGSNAAWAGEKPKALADLSPWDCTIMVVEVADAGIQWTEPGDLNLELLSTPQPATVSSRHNTHHDFFHYPERVGGFVAMADGSVLYLPGGLLDSEVSPGLFKIGGCPDKYFSDEKLAMSGRRIYWPNCIALAVLIASGGLLIVGSLVQRLRRPARTKTAGTTDEHGSTRIEAGQ